MKLIGQNPNHYTIFDITMSTLMFLNTLHDICQKQGSGVTAEDLSRLKKGSSRKLIPPI